MSSTQTIKRLVELSTEFLAPGQRIYRPINDSNITTFIMHLGHVLDAIIRKVKFCVKSTTGTQLSV